MNKIERLINLTAYLLDSDKPITLDELKDTVYKGQSGGGALRRMFERDKEELREMGIDVKAVKRGDGDEVGYTIERNEYYLPHLDLSPEQRVALTMVSRLFLGSGTPFSGPAHSALLKLAFDADAGAGLPAEEKVPHVHWIGVPREREALSDILEGLVRRKLLTFSYRSLDAKEPAEREVEPYGLFNRDGHWYLAGKCHLRGEIRCFRLDRIASEVRVNPASPRTPDFAVPSNFDIEKEANWDWPLPCEEEDVEARVRFSSRLAFAHTSARAPVVAVKRQRDGSLEVTYEVADPEQFVDWVLEFGIDARIVAPPELVNMARERLQAVLSVVRGRKR
jgi:proteasome accessory factor B